jgi:hypothetical protein
MSFSCRVTTHNRPSHSANRYTGHAAAKLAAAAAYNRYQPPPTCDSYRRRHRTSFEGSQWSKNDTTDATAATSSATASAAPAPATILLSSTHHATTQAVSTATAPTAGTSPKRAITPSITPGQPRPIIVQHIVPVGNVHKIDRLHRGTSRAAGGAFYTS